MVKLTRQDVFNRVWDHFITQDQPFSKDGTGDTCKYRGQHGAKCAFGIFIPDDKYTKNFEGNTVTSLYDMCQTMDDVSIFEQFDFDDLSFLNELQSCHDTSENKDAMVRRLRDVAVKYGLTV